MKLIFQYIKKYKKYIIINFFAVMGFILIEIGIPTILATGINNKFMNNDTNYIIKMSLYMLLIAIAGLISLIILAYSTNKMVTDLVMDIREDLFKKYKHFLMMSITSLVYPDL